MPNEVVADLWKQGFVTVKRLDDVDNVGAYLTAYLGDMELSEAHAQGITSGEVKTVEYEENGEQKTILFCRSGHGLIDMAAYDQYLAGNIH